MREFTIRPYTPADRSAVIALWQACNLTRPWNNPARDIQRKRSVAAELFVVGELDGRVVATAMGGYDGHRGWINYVAVEPACRRRGYARQLIACLENALLARGCPKINLQVRATNELAVAVYERLGFQREDVISLGKRLIEDEASGLDREDQGQRQHHEGLEVRRWRETFPAARPPNPTPLEPKQIAALLAAMIAIFIVNNCLVMPLMRSLFRVNLPFVLLPGLAVGVSIGQVNLIGVWAAVSSGPVIVRLPWAYLLVVVMWVSLTLGARQSNVSEQEIVQLAGVLLLGSTIVQIPLWCASRIFGWQLVPPRCRTAEQPSSGQYHLGHLFLGMLILAVTLACLRAFFPSMPWSDLRMQLDHVLPVILTAVIVCNLGFVVPCIWAAFFVPVSAATVTRWVVGTVLVTTVEFSILCLILGSPGPDLWNLVVFFLAMNLAQSGIVYGVLRLLVMAGFQLQRQAPSGHQPPPPAGA